MYEEFYGLNSRPFLTVPDPNYLFWSETHVMAYTMLRYGIMTRAPITVITGEIGSGKTTLLRKLMTEAPHDLAIGLISNMQGGRGELLHWVLTALNQDIQTHENYVQLFRRFQDFVIDAYAQGKRTVLILDEAQNLTIEALEELRMMSNINADSDELLQIILVGQPQLRDLLGSPKLEQFIQRISSDFHLQPLRADDVSSYIEARLAQAGARWRIFHPGACPLIHEATRGVPRLINILCDLCLVYGFAAESKVIEDHLVREFLAGARKAGIYRQFSPVAGPPTIMRQVN